MAEEKIEPETRVMLWSTPRSISTAFEQSIKSLPGILSFHEPFSTAYYLGEDRVSPRYMNTTPLKNFRFKEVITSLESSYPGKKAVFAKDMGYAIGGDFSLIPDGYTHSFLIRHPRRSVASLYHIIESGKAANWTEFHPVEIGYRDLTELLQHLNHHGHDCVVVDADDLLQDPASIMSQYCSAVGFTYSDAMLSWPPEQGIQDREEWGIEWYETLSGSTGFIKQDSKSLPDVSGFPELVQDTVEHSLQYYEELYRLRIRP